jgi:hypothetical protein
MAVYQTWQDGVARLGVCRAVPRDCTARDLRNLAIFYKHGAGIDGFLAIEDADFGQQERRHGAMFCVGKCVEHCNSDIATHRIANACMN